MSDTTRCAKCGHSKTSHTRDGCISGHYPGGDPCWCVAFVPLTERAEPEAESYFQTRFRIELLAGGEASLVFAGTENRNNYHEMKMALLPILAAQQSSQPEAECRDEFHFRLDGPTGAQFCGSCGKQWKHPRIKLPRPVAQQSAATVPGDTELLDWLVAHDAHVWQEEDGWNVSWDDGQGRPHVEAPTLREAIRKAKTNG